ncbi:putative formin-like protein 3-like [Capsicum annuum]|nr:putative formin-like protein 3-like [Capsicum annuum]KAF3636587.1 putative formin-like protein 3-like [Capsicum annuum]
MILDDIDDIDRAVGSGARDIVNYSSLIMRTTISFRDGNWQKIVLKHGEAMWVRVRDKFEVRNGLPEYKLQGFVISTMQRLFRSWKAQLQDVELDDLKHLVEYLGSDEFKVVSKRNKRNREKQITKHSCGTRSFAEVEESMRNPLTGGQLHQLIVEQQSEDIENPMTSDEILSLVLGVRSGYVQGKGHGKKPPKKSQMQQAKHRGQCFFGGRKYSSRDAT